MQKTFRLSEFQQEAFAEISAEEARGARIVEIARAQRNAAVNVVIGAETDPSLFQSWRIEVSKTEVICTAPASIYDDPTGKPPVRPWTTETPLASSKPEFQVSGTGTGKDQGSNATGTNASLGASAVGDGERLESTIDLGSHSRVLQG